MEIDKLVYKAKNSKWEKIYWNCIFELRKNVTKEMVDKCFSLIKSNDYKEKKVGIDVLCQLGTNRKKFVKEFLKQIFKILKTENDEALISSCLFAIGHNNKNLNVSQIRFLTQFKNSKSKNIRYALVFSQLALKNEESMNSLLFLMKDKSPQVRDWATFGIGTQTDIDSEIIRESLYKNCFDKDEQTKSEAIVGLVNRNDKRAFDIIENELEKNNVGSLIFDTILNIENGEIFLPKLKLIFEESKKDNNINKEWLNSLENCIHIFENEED